MTRDAHDSLRVDTPLVPHCAEHDDHMDAWMTKDSVSGMHWLSALSGGRLGKGREEPGAQGQVEPRLVAPPAPTHTWLPKMVQLPQGSENNGAMITKTRKRTGPAASDASGVAHVPFLLTTEQAAPWKPKVQSQMPMSLHIPTDAPPHTAPLLTGHGDDDGVGVGVPVAVGDTDALTDVVGVSDVPKDGLAEMLPLKLGDKLGDLVIDGLLDRNGVREMVGVMDVDIVTVGVREKERGVSVTVGVMESEDVSDAVGVVEMEEVSELGGVRVGVMLMDCVIDEVTEIVGVMEDVSLMVGVMDGVTEMELVMDLDTEIDGVMDLDSEIVGVILDVAVTEVELVADRDVLEDKDGDTVGDGVGVKLEPLDGVMEMDDVKLRVGDVEMV